MKVYAQRDEETFIVNDDGLYIQLNIETGKAYSSKSAETFLRSDDWEEAQPTKEQVEAISDIVDKIHSGTIKPRQLTS